MVDGFCKNLAISRNIGSQRYLSSSRLALLSRVQQWQKTFVCILREDFANHLNLDWFSVVPEKGQFRGFISIFRCRTFRHGTNIILDEHNVIKTHSKIGKNFSSNCVVYRRCCLEQLKFRLISLFILPFFLIKQWMFFISILLSKIFYALPSRVNTLSKRFHEMLTDNVGLLKRKACIFESNNWIIQILLRWFLKLNRKPYCHIAMFVM